jgi:hypothetical protein
MMELKEIRYICIRMQKYVCRERDTESVYTHPHTYIHT